VVVGAPFAGREQQESERLIGPFLSLLPFRVKLAGSLSFRELLHQARQTTLDAFAQQEVSLERILEAVGVRRGTSHYPIFQFMLNLLIFPPLGGELPGGIDVEAIQTGGATAKYDMALYIRDMGDSLLLDLIFSTDLFDRERMDALLDQFLGVLELAAEHPDTAIDRFPVEPPPPGPDVIA
jgi:non-ribosomal peptide synthetase component F